ncbi:MAG: CDP-glycerol glycerophosphotransferase family protein [Candidatus Yanofskybacteria bacterium]|nr:CDP-glycerol glycerophosphotransferase family protein [Candidatus Yanofskybacteria bacterium]
MEEFILVSLKDMGGLNNLFPVIRELERRGRKIEIVASASGVASEVLKKNGIRFTLGEDAVKVSEKFPNPRLLVTSMCSAHNIGRNLISILRDTCQTVAVQDYWGVRLTDEWSPLEHRPHYITVNDTLGAELVKKAWPEFNPSRIWQTGFPMFDTYSNINNSDAVKARTEILTKLNKSSNSAVVFFPCGALNGASQFLSEILEIINSYLTNNRSRQPLVFIPRCHPRLKKEPLMVSELNLWNEAMDKLESYHPEVLINDEAVIRADMKTLLMASNLVISDYSTSLLEAGLVGARLDGKPNISACYIPSIAKDMEKDLGPLLKEPPYVTLGCSAKATNNSNLHDLVTEFLDDKNNARRDSLRENQKEHLKTDGHNSKRVADMIETLL